MGRASITSAAKTELRTGSSSPREGTGDTRVFPWEGSSRVKGCFMSKFPYNASLLAVLALPHQSQQHPSLPRFQTHILSNSSHPSGNHKSPVAPRPLCREQRVMEQRPPNAPNLLPGLVLEPFPVPTRSEAGAVDQEYNGIAVSRSRWVHEVQQQQGGSRDAFPSGYQPTMEPAPEAHREAREDAGEAVPSSPQIQTCFQTPTNPFSMHKCQEHPGELPPAINPPAHPNHS